MQLGKYVPNPSNKNGWVMKLKLLPGRRLDTMVQQKKVNALGFNKEKQAKN